MQPLEGAWELEQRVWHHNPVVEGGVPIVISIPWGVQWGGLLLWWSGASLLEVQTALLRVEAEKRSLFLWGETVPPTLWGGAAYSFSASTARACLGSVGGSRGYF